MTASSRIVLGALIFGALAALVLAAAWNGQSAAFAADGDRVRAQAPPGCIDSVIPGGAPVCVSPQPEPPRPTMSPTPTPEPSPSESPPPAEPAAPPPGTTESPAPGPSPTPGPSPRASKSPSPTPTPSPTEIAPAVDPVYPVPTPDVVDTVRAPELEPLGSGFSLFSPEGALMASLITLAAMAAGVALFGFFRQSRARAKQARFESHIYQAVQDMKEKTLLVGKPGTWSARETA